MKNHLLSHKLIEHFRKNLVLYLITLLFLCIGIVIGVYSVKYMGSIERNNLISYIRSVYENINIDEINRKYIFIEAIKNNIIIILAIWFLGLTMLGLPFILIVDLLKGFTIGFTSSLVINGLGSAGILINLFLIFPQNIIYIPCIIIASVFAMDFSINLLKNNSMKIMNKNSNLTQIVSYSTLFLCITMIMFIGFIIEGYATPNIMKLISLNGGIM